MPRRCGSGLKSNGTAAPETHHPTTSSGLTTECRGKPVRLPNNEAHGYFSLTISPLPERRRMRIG